MNSEETILLSGILPSVPPESLGQLEADAENNWTPWSTNTYITSSTTSASYSISTNGGIPSAVTESEAEFQWRADGNNPRTVYWSTVYTSQDGSTTNLVTSDNWTSNGAGRKSPTYDLKVTQGPGTVTLLPCQFRLLNGSTTSADVDGIDFSGNRPTTISATASYTTPAFVSTNEAANAGTNVIGVDTPIGYGRPTSPFAGNSYVCSIVMLAAVASPSATSSTYGWNRVVQGREVTIINTLTSTNAYWHVTGVAIQNGYPNPLPDHPSTSYETDTPSTNRNVVAIYDNPGMYLTPCAGNGAGIGDYAYLKDDFTYSLRNSIGSTSTGNSQQIGVYFIAKRINATGNMANDWQGTNCTASTTNIPNCSTVTIPGDESNCTRNGAHCVRLERN